MVDPWKILGIGPTGEAREIKKAYAARLKHRHPEDDPDGFQELRQAYERALEFARWQKEQFEQMGDIWAEAPPPNLVFPVPGVSPRRVPPPLHSTRSRPPAPFVPPLLPNEAEWAGQAADELMRQVELLHDNEEAWTSFGAWRTLLQNEALWNVDTRDAFQQRLIELLAVNASSLPAKVWALLDQEFNWSEQRWSLYRRLPPDRVELVLDYVEFLGAVEKAERLWNEGVSREARAELEPIAARLTGELGTRARLVLGRCYLKVGSLARARSVLEEIIQADPRCVPAYLVLASVFRASTYLDPGAERTRELYQKVLELDPENEEARSGLARIEKDQAERETRLAAPSRLRAQPAKRTATHEETGRSQVRPDNADPRRLNWVIVAACTLLIASEVSRDLHALVGLVPWIAAVAVVAFALVWWRRRSSQAVGLGLGPGAARPQPAPREGRSRQRESHSRVLNIGHGAAHTRPSARRERSQRKESSADLLNIGHGAAHSRSFARKAHAWTVRGWLKPPMDPSDLLGYLALGFTALFALAVIAAILWVGNVGWP